jgi:TRAP-type C4-dicarboxylate transport system permease small subunit
MKLQTSGNQTGVNRIGSIISVGVDWVLSKLRWIAAAGLFSLALLTAVDVIGRYVFSRPVTGSNDIQELMMVVIIFMAAGYCTLQERNANADVVIIHLSRKTRAILGSITYLLSALIFGLISWQLVMSGWREIFSTTGRATLLLVIPVGPFIMVAAIGSVAVTVACLVVFFRYLSQSKGDKEANI